MAMRRTPPTSGIAPGVWSERSAPPTATGASPQPSAPISEQDRIAASLASGNVWTAIVLFFGFGLLLTALCNFAFGGVNTSLLIRKLV